MAAKEAATKITYLLGQCMPSVKSNAARIRVKRLIMDQRFLMYFNEHEFVYANDPKKLCKSGDTVLIRNLPERLTRLVTHEVVDVIYQLGDVIDPITGRKVIKNRYRDDIEADNELFGKTDSAFDYNKAPPRGSQEDKRDFSRRRTYIKYNEDDQEPYAV